MKFVILAVLLGMFIAFVVMVVKASKQWRWYHITSAVFVMLFATILMFPTAAVLKSRQAWHKVKEDLDQEGDTSRLLANYGSILSDGLAVRKYFSLRDLCRGSR